MIDSKIQREKANIWAFIAWVLGFIGFIVVYTIRYDDDFAMFHAKQSLTLAFINIVVLAVSWMFSMAPGIGILMQVLTRVMMALTIAISLAGAYFSLKGIRYEFPLLHSYSLRLSI